MLANALHNLYKDNEIIEEGLESGLKSLPDYLAEKVRADLQTDWQHLVTSTETILFVLTTRGTRTTTTSCTEHLYCKNSTSNATGKKY